MKLSGYPDNFIIPISNSQVYKQFGNSVTVPVIEEIELLEAIPSHVKKDLVNV